MGIDTELQGSPGSIEGAAHWVADTLRPGVDGASTALTTARNGAAGDWKGEGGDSFGTWSGSAVTRVDELVEGSDTVSTTLLTFAGKLRQGQHRMATIREPPPAPGWASTAT